MNYSFLQIKPLSVLLIFLLFFGCNKNNVDDFIENNKELQTYETIPFEVPVNNVEYICEWNDIGVTKESSSITTTDCLNNTVKRFWKAKYSENILELSHNVPSCGDETVATSVFVFNKNGGCIALNYAYYISDDQFDGKEIIQYSNTTLEVQNWVENDHLSGKLTFTHSPDHPKITQKFWMDIKPEDYTESLELEYNDFNDCLGTYLPIYVDIDNDDTNDFAIYYELFQNLDNVPQFNIYRLNLISLNPDNIMLSTKGGGYIFNNYRYTSLSTENKVESTENIRIALYTDYNNPYKIYNYSRGIYFNYDHRTGSNSINDNYILVKLNKNDEAFYGWINLTIDLKNCYINIDDLYLNSTPNEHIIVF